MGGSGSGSQEVSIKLLTMDAVHLRGCLQEALFLVPCGHFTRAAGVSSWHGSWLSPEQVIKSKQKAAVLFYDLVQGLANFILKG